MRRLMPLLAWDAVLMLTALVLRLLPLPNAALDDDPIMRVFALVRLLAGAWVGFLALKTTGCALAIAVHLPARLVSLLARGLPGPIARATLATAGFVLVLPVTSSGAAGAAGPAPVMRKVPNEEAAAPVSATAPAAPSPATVGIEEDTPTPTSVAEFEHVVRPGDHLWAIAERLTETSLGRHVADAEVLPTWQRLITANRDRVANPDLIHPGQVLRLPPSD